MALRKDVFISATSRDLALYRETAVKAVIKLEAHPIEEEGFPTDHRALTVMLAQRLDPCDAVIHLVGFHYGSEPVPEPGLPRRSYTQWEYHRATEATPPKPTYVFFARKDCEDLPPTTEDPEKQRLQREHRERLLRAGHTPYEFSSRDELAQLILAIDELRARLQPRLCRIPFPPLREKFAGRTALLETLARDLAADGPSVVTQPAALHADGGVGKTAFAVEFGWRLFESARFDFVLFLNASSPATLESDLASLCGIDALDLPERTEREQPLRRAAVLRWLHTSGQAGRTLFLLDNADADDARDAVCTLFPQLAPAAVLITSRGEISPAVRTHRLDYFTDKEARDFFDTHLDPTLLAATPDALLNSIAEALGHLPLALELAVSFMKDTRQTPAEWLEEWNADPAETLEHSNRDRVLYRQDDPHVPIPLARVWEKSVARLSPGARAVLGILAWLAPRPATLPLEPFKALKFWKQMRADLGELARASLIQWPPGSDGASIHPVLQAVRRHRLEGEESAAAMEAAVRWLNAIRPGPGWDEVGWRLWERLAPHFRALLRHVSGEPVEKEAALLMNQYALWLNNRAEYLEAEPLYRRALAIAEESRGPAHPYVAASLNNLAELLRVTNRPAEAEPLYRRAIAIGEESPVPEHPELAVRLNNLALLLADTNRPAEAESLYRRALAIDEKHYGPEHPTVALDLNNLALLLNDTNRAAEAEPLFRRAAAISEKSLGPEHPDLAIRISNLALLLSATNRLSEAEPLLRRALAIIEKSYGAHHPNVSTTINNLAELLSATNRLSEAEPLLRRALAIGEKSLGPEHPSVAIRLNNLARLLQATNRLAEAEPLSRRHLVIFLRFTFGTGHQHPHLMHAIENYGGLLNAMGASREEAQERIDEIVERVRREVGMPRRSGSVFRTEEEAGA